jgi:hypothetical protein
MNTRFDEFGEVPERHHGRHARRVVHLITFLGEFDIGSVGWVTHSMFFGCGPQDDMEMRLLGNVYVHEKKCFSKELEYRQDVRLRLLPGRELEADFSLVEADLDLSLDRWFGDWTVDKQRRVCGSVRVKAINVKSLLPDGIWF